MQNNSMHESIGWSCMGVSNTRVIGFDREHAKKTVPRQTNLEGDTIWEGPVYITTCACQVNIDMQGAC